MIALAWWRRRTLRFRLAAWYGIGGVVLLTAFCVVIYGFVSRRMAQPLDRQLRAAHAVGAARRERAFQGGEHTQLEGRALRPGA